MFSAEHVCRKITIELIVTFTTDFSLSSTMLNAARGKVVMCDPVCEHRFRSCHTIYFILSTDDIGYWTIPSFVEPFTPRHLSGAGTLLMPANIRAITIRYRKSVAHILHCARQLCIFSSAPFFSTGALCLRHFISREYGKQRASYPKNAGDYPMRSHHPRPVTVAVLMQPAA